jgi:TetR/AcrR family fatty acid metabolism transcriptional regulator
VAEKKLSSNTRMSKDERVASILLKAKQHLRQVGHENFSPVEVAQDCGVSEATIYRYFASKQDLLVRVAEFWVEELLAGSPVLNKNDSIYDRLRQVVRYSLWVIHSEPALSKFVLIVIRREPGFRASRIYSLNKRFTSNTTLVVQEAIDQGVFRNDVPPTMVRNMIFGTIEHEVWSYLLADGDFSLDESARLIADIVFKGLAVEPAINVETFNRSLAAIEKGVRDIDAAVAKLRD